MKPDSQNGTKIQTLQLDKFYQTLKKLKIVKSSPHYNLSQFLRQADQDSILVSKLLKIVEVFMSDSYLKSFGYHRKKFSVLLEKQ